MNFTDKFYFAPGYELGHLVKGRIIPADISAKRDVPLNVDNKLEHTITASLGMNILGNFDIGLKYGFGLTPLSNTNLTNASGTDVAIRKEYTQYLHVYFKYLYGRKRLRE